MKTILVVCIGMLLGLGCRAVVESGTYDFISYEWAWVNNSAPDAESRICGIIFNSRAQFKRIGTLYGLPLWQYATSEGTSGSPCETGTVFTMDEPTLRALHEKGMAAEEKYARHLEAVRRILEQQELKQQER